MKPRVLLDVDGVLADFHTPCIEIINRLMGTDHKVEDFDDWDIFNALKVPQDVKALVYDEMHKFGWCTNIGIYDGAKDGVKMLREIADVYIVTSPMDGDTWESERKRWLMYNFNIRKKYVMSGSGKHICAGDFLVDDKIENLISWKRHFPNGHPIRWVMPHLASHEWPGDQTRDWSELCRMVHEYPIGPRVWEHHAEA